MNRIRRIANKCLQKGKVYELPVDSARLASKLGYKAMSYSDGKKAGYNIPDSDIDGITLPFDGKCFIFYRDGLEPIRQNQVIAHELGHALLHCDERSPYYTGVPTSDRNIEEEANLFERYVIAPVFYLDAMDVRSPHKIQDVTGYSYEVSKLIYKDLTDYWKAIENNDQVLQSKKSTMRFKWKNRKKIETTTYTQKKKQRVFSYVFLTICLVVVLGFLSPPIVGDDPDVYLAANQGFTYHYDTCPVVIRRGKENMIMLKESKAISGGYVECDCSSEGER